MLFIFASSYLHIMQNSKLYLLNTLKVSSCPSSAQFSYLKVMLPFSFILLQRWFIYMPAWMYVITTLFIQMIELLHTLFHTFLLIQIYFGEYYVVVHLEFLIHFL